MPSEQQDRQRLPPPAAQLEGDAGGEPTKKQKKICSISFWGGEWNEVTKECIITRQRIAHLYVLKHPLSSIKHTHKHSHTNLLLLFYVFIWAKPIHQTKVSLLHTHASTNTKTGMHRDTLKKRRSRNKLRSVSLLLKIAFHHHL